MKAVIIGTAVGTESASGGHYYAGRGQATPRMVFLAVTSPTPPQTERFEVWQAHRQPLSRCHSWFYSVKCVHLSKELF